MGIWNEAVVLVTGAHGFTGSHLCRELIRAGAQVKALVKRGASLLNLKDIQTKCALVLGDVTDFGGLLDALEGVDYVFHPAAIVPVMEARSDPQKSFMVNGIGAFNVADAARQVGVKKMLHISTCHVYGNQPESELPIKETALPFPGDLYAASKIAAEIYLRPLIDEGFPILISRAFAKYGPGQAAQYLIPHIITQLIRGETPQLGSSKPTRDYSYILDIVRGYMLILEKGEPGEIYHLSSEREISVREVYEKISKIVGVQTRPVWNENLRTQDILRLFGDSEKARKKLGWKPEIGLEDGLKQTVDWWKRRMQPLDQ